MNLESSDNIISLNKKLNFLLRKDIENQKLVKDKNYVVPEKNNYNLTPNLTKLFEFQNDTLPCANNIFHMFEKPFEFYSIIKTTKIGNTSNKQEYKYRFHQSLSQTVFSIAFYDGEDFYYDNNLKKYSYYFKYKKINNLFVPKDTTNFRLEIIDNYKDESIIDSRELHLYFVNEDEDKKIIYNIEHDDIDNNGNKIFYNQPILVYDRGR